MATSERHSALSAIVNSGYLLISDSGRLKMPTVNTYFRRRKHGLGFRSGARALGCDQYLLLILDSPLFEGVYV
ncbi:hypothetical protein L1049_001282 [Liquidambar formosana]|uniref:Uncharacterized protein n=1 Tax=Liquidambar formosana TaxID=63359 RepID=A0AAP0R4Y0_LIQFO